MLPFTCKGFSVSILTEKCIYMYVPCSYTWLWSGRMCKTIDIVSMVKRRPRGVHLSREGSSHPAGHTDPRSNHPR